MYLLHGYGYVQPQCRAEQGTYVFPVERRGIILARPPLPPLGSHATVRGPAGLSPLHRRTVLVLCTSRTVGIFMGRLLSSVTGLAWANVLVRVLGSFIRYGHARPWDSQWVAFLFPPSLPL